MPIHVNPPIEKIYTSELIRKANISKSKEQIRKIVYGYQDKEISTNEIIAMQMFIDSRMLCGKMDILKVLNK